MSDFGLEWVKGRDDGIISWIGLAQKTPVGSSDSTVWIVELGVACNLTNMSIGRTVCVTEHKQYAMSLARPSNGN